jgi:hypothetical protein
LSGEHSTWIEDLQHTYANTDNVRVDAKQNKNGRERARVELMSAFRCAASTHARADQARDTNQFTRERLTGGQTQVNKTFAGAQVNAATAAEFISSSPSSTWKTKNIYSTQTQTHTIQEWTFEQSD